MQMIKDVLLCLIFLINIEWTFNLARKVCWWNWSQMSLKMMKQIMLMKYYNQTMNLNLDEIITEFWNIYCKEKNDDQEINECWFILSIFEDCSDADLFINLQYHFIY